MARRRWCRCPRYSLTVQASASNPPTITGTAATAAKVGVVYSFQPAARRSGRQQAHLLHPQQAVLGQRSIRPPAVSGTPPTVAAVASKYHDRRDRRGDLRVAEAVQHHGFCRRGEQRADDLGLPFDQRTGGYCVRFPGRRPPMPTATRSLSASCEPARVGVVQYADRAAFGYADGDGHAQQRADQRDRRQGDDVSPAFTVVVSAAPSPGTAMLGGCRRP